MSASFNLLLALRTAQPLFYWLCARRNRSFIGSAHGATAGTRDAKLH
jgi:hypothetical protein